MSKTISDSRGFLIPEIRDILHVIAKTRWYVTS